MTKQRGRWKEGIPGPQIRMFEDLPKTRSGSPVVASWTIFACSSLCVPKEIINSLKAEAVLLTVASLTLGVPGRHSINVK